MEERGRIKVGHEKEASKKRRPRAGLKRSTPLLPRKDLQDVQESLGGKRPGLACARRFEISRRI